MIGLEHFDAMCNEVGWDHAVNVTQLVYTNPTIIGLCKTYKTATFAADDVTDGNDVDIEPFFTIRKHCIQSLRKILGE